MKSYRDAIRNLIKESFDVKLSEGNFTRNELYKKSYYIPPFVSKIMNGEPIKLADGTEAVVNPEGRSEEEWTNYFKTEEKPLLTLDNGTQIFLSKVDKLPFSSDDTKVKNKGDVAEGILGAAMATRFYIRNERDITPDDIWETLLELDMDGEDSSPNKKVTIKKLSKQTSDINGNAKDTISLTIGLSTINFKDMTNPAKKPILDDIYSSAAKFANSEEVIDQHMEWALNNEKNKIDVSSVGTEDQKGTKVDLKIAADGNFVPVGLISLKAGGTRQIGQRGRTFQALQEMFQGIFGVDITDDEESMSNWIQQVEKSKTSGDAVKALALNIYKNAYTKAKSKFSGNRDDVEVAFLENFADAIRKEAVLDDMDAVLVHLDKGDYKILEFTNIRNVVKNLDLDIKLVEKKGAGSKVPTPYIIVYDKNSGKSFVSIRPKFEKAGTVRHYIEKESEFVNNLARKYVRKADPKVSAKKVPALQDKINQGIVTDSREATLLMKYLMGDELTDEEAEDVLDYFGGMPEAVEMYRDEFEDLKNQTDGAL